MEDTNNAEGPRRLALGVALLAAVAALWLVVSNSPELTRPYGRDPGPAFQPLVVLWLLGISALVLVADGLRRIWHDGWDLRATATAAGDLLVPSLMIASLLVFVVAAEAIGFLSTSLLFSVFWAVLLAAQDAQSGQRRVVILAGIASLFVAAGIYLVFERVIGVPLP